MTRILFAVLISVIPQYCIGQFKHEEKNISSNTKIIVSKFQEKFHLTLDSTRTPSHSKDNYKDYSNFLDLCKYASTKELEELTSHPIPTIRCYSFWAISQRDSVDLISIISMRQNDTTQKANAYMGCFYAIFSVKEFFLNVITNKYYHHGKVNLSVEQKKLVDSLNK